MAGRALAEPGLRWTSFQLAMAAQLSMKEIVISHRTAAELHGFPVSAPDDEVPECHVIIRAHRQAGSRIRAHLVRLAADEVETGPCGLWLTTPARTAVDCLAAFPFGFALDLWAWVATRKILDREHLLAAIDDRQNWHGTPQLKRIADLGADGALSQAEVLMQELLRRANLTGWIANAPVHDEQGLIGLIDLLFEQARLAVEIDGWRAHQSHAAFVADRRRGNRLAAAGYRVLHFTWPDLTERPNEVIAEIRQVLAARLGLGR